MKARVNDNPGTQKNAEKVINPAPDTGRGDASLDEHFRMLVAQQPFLAGMTPRQLDLLAESALLMQFQPGEWIFLEGDLANRFFLILEGEVVIEADAEENGRVPIEILGQGDDLGWSWLFAPYHFHFSARALTPTRVLCFYGTRLRRQCEEDHELGYELLKRVSQVAISRLQATRKQLLKTAAAVEAVQ